ncbi:hypothetical protein HY384_01785 [Candidatus Daviesbacteria bacterium]|nr:hypothetical protein [Candidatus Daviesbacteria bacterium]
MFKKPIVKLIIVLIIIFLGIWLIIQQLKTPKDNPISTSADNQTSSVVSEKDPPKIVSTKPDSLKDTEDTIVSATEVLEITFNRSIENVGEFKLRIEPKTEVKVELSGDRKTAKIIPVKPYDLGSTYTLFIGTETKFDGVGRWGQEKIFHFRTIKYTGV